MELFTKFSLIYHAAFLLLLFFIFFTLTNKKWINGFLSVFNAILPDHQDSIDKSLKFKMAKAAAYILYAVLLVLCVSIFLSFVVPLHQIDLSADKPEAGENKYTGPLGDLFNGLLTPILTFLTFCGLLITIMIQNAQMKATLKELELNRREMENSTNALQAQVKTSQAQKFDSNFYSMLQLHTTVAEELNKNIKLINYEFNEINSKSYEWSEFDNPDELRSFFLINYQILKFIRKNETENTISHSEAKQYSNIVRAMLNDELYGLIFSNCSIERFSKYKDLVEHYSFLEHLVFSRFEDPYVLRMIVSYKECVFGDGYNLNKFLKKNNEIFSNTVGEKIKTYLNDLRYRFDNIDYSMLHYRFSAEVSNSLAEKAKESRIFSSEIDNIRNIIKNQINIESLKDNIFVSKISSKNLSLLNNYGFDFNAYVDFVKEIFAMAEGAEIFMAETKMHLALLEGNIGRKP